MKRTMKRIIALMISVAIIYCVGSIQYYGSSYSGNSMPQLSQTERVQPAEANIPFVGPPAPQPLPPPSLATGMGILFYLVVTVGGVLSFTTTFFMMRMIQKGLNVQTKHIDTVTSVPSEQSVEAEIEPPTPVRAKIAVKRSPVPRLFQPNKSDRVISNDTFDLSAFARKLGVSRGELDLKIHLQELKESAV